jgi:hypothetical protein
MATSAVTPPPGYALEGQPGAPPSVPAASGSAGITPPPGYSLEDTAVAGVAPANATEDENSSNPLLTSYGAATRGGFNSVANATLDAIKGAAEFLHPKPQNDGESEAFQVAGIGGMLAHRLVNSLADMGGALLQPHEIAAAIHDINNSPDPMGTYLKVLQKTAATGAGQALTAVATEGVGKGARAAKGAVSTALDTGKGIASEIRHGSDVAQPGAQEAVRTAVGAKPGVPIVQGATGTSVMDDVVGNLDKMRRDLYAQASEKAGFDVRQAKEQLTSAQQRLKLMEGTDSVDIADQARQQVAELQEKLASANDADPALMKAADQAHGKYAAAQQFRKALVRASDVDGTVNVPKLLTASKNLRFTKYGDQLEAFMGKAQADEYMQHLEAMRDMGAHAATVQNVAKWVAKIAGGGLLLEGGHQAVSLTQ